MTQDKPITRRAFLRRAGWWLLIATAVGLAGYGRLFEPRNVAVRRITIAVPDLPAGLRGLRIGHLSDLHVGHPLGYPSWPLALDLMAEQDVDLIVDTGDLVHFQHPAGAVQEAADALAALSAPLGTYWVPGNHEHVGESGRRLAAALAARGVTPLWNRGVPLEVGGHTLWLAGIDDFLTGAPDLGQALAGAPAGAPVLLASHMPDFAPRAVARGVALQVSGHSHGGQVRVPLIGAIHLPRGGRRFPLGLQQVPDSTTQVFTNAGVGVSGPPIRINCPPEIAILTLV